MLTEHIENLVDVAPLLAPRVELAVGERTGTALTETVVRLRVDFLVLRYQRHVALAVVDVLTSFYYHRPQSELYKLQGGKETGGPLTDDHYLRASFHILIFSVLVLLVLRIFVDVGAHLEVDVYRALTGIDTLLQHTHGINRPYVETFLLGEVCLYSLLAVCIFGQNP